MSRTHINFSNRNFLLTSSLCLSYFSQTLSSISQLRRVAPSNASCDFKTLHHTHRTTFVITFDAGSEFSSLFTLLSFLFLLVVLKTRAHVDASSFLSFRLSSSLLSQYRHDPLHCFPSVPHPNKASEPKGSRPKRSFKTKQKRSKARGG